MITRVRNLTPTAILAGLKLEQDLIYRILRRDIMQESTVYRSILEEGEAKGEARKQREIALNLLRADVAMEIITSTTGLSIESLQQLQEELRESSSN
jgi:predicted transposase YdaD